MVGGMGGDLNGLTTVSLSTSESIVGILGKERFELVTKSGRTRLKNLEKDSA